MAQPRNGDVAALTRAANDLIEEIEALNRASGTTLVDLAQRSRRNRRLILATAVGLVLDVALTVAMAIGWAGIARNNHRIDQVNTRLDNAQTTQRAKALCPLYRVLLDGERFTPPNLSPEQTQARANAFKVIHAGFDALNCKEVIK